MAMKNIEMFDIYTAKVLAKLYKNFPLKIDIDVCDMLGLIIDQENMQVPKECDILNDTIAWLQESGFIYFEGSHVYGFSRVVLSAKGLEVLKSTPSSITPRDGIGESLKDVLTQGKKESIRQVVGTILSQAVRIIA